MTTTLLHLICKREDFDMELLYLLYKNKANFNTEDSNGETALQILCKNPAVTPNMLLFVYLYFEINVKNKEFLKVYLSR